MPPSRYSTQPNAKAGYSNSKMFGNVGIQRLAQADGHGLEIADGESTKRHEPLDTAR